MEEIKRGNFLKIGFNFISGVEINIIEVVYWVLRVEEVLVFDDYLGDLE